MPARKICEHGITPKSKCVTCTNEYERVRARKKYSSERNQRKYLADRDAQIVRMVNQRARKLGIEGVVPMEYWLRIKDRCYYCGATKFPIHLDHTIPLSKGGLNTPENVRATCCFCNLAKADWPEEYFLEWLAHVRSGSTV